MTAEIIPFQRKQPVIVQSVESTVLIYVDYLKAELTPDDYILFLESVVLIERYDQQTDDIRSLVDEYFSLQRTGSGS